MNSASLHYYRWIDKTRAWRQVERWWIGFVISLWLHVMIDMILEWMK